MKMKKLFAITLTAAMCMSLAACGSSSGDSDASADAGSSTDSAGAGTDNSGGSAEESTASSDSGSENSAATTDAGDALDIDDVWPSGTTVYVDVPAKAGGGTDLYARYMTAALTEMLDGVNFVVTNYDTTEVGAEHTKNADPDGLTLTIAACTGMDNYMSGSSNVNPNEDYVVVGKLMDGGPQAIIAAPGAPYSNLAELGEYITENPNELVVGCALGGTSQIILYNIIASLGDGCETMVNYVQCSSEADKLTQTASGSIDIANCSIPNAQSYDADGKLTILGTVGPKVATLETMSELVDANLSEIYATTLEQGIDFSWDAGYYVMAPAGTPDNICQAINNLLVKLPDNEGFTEGMKTMASYINCPELEEARADWSEEWDAQIQYLKDLGLYAR